MKTAPFLILIFLSACVPNTDEDCVSKSELDRANAKIETLQSQLGLMDSKTPLSKTSDNLLAKEKPKNTSKHKLETIITDKRWTYTQVEDAMTGDLTYHAHVISSNTLESNYTQTREQYARLILRSNPELGKNIIVQIDTGRFYCSLYEKCSILVRFDDDKPIRFDATATTENLTGTIFIYDYSRFKGEMLKAKRLRISADIHRRTTPVFEFDVRGFDQNKYRPAT